MGKNMLYTNMMVQEDYGKIPIIKNRVSIMMESLKMVKDKDMVFKTQQDYNIIEVIGKTI